MTMEALWTATVVGVPHDSAPGRRRGPALAQHRACPPMCSRTGADRYHVISVNPPPSRRERWSAAISSDGVRQRSSQVHRRGGESRVRPGAAPLAARMRASSARARPRRRSIATRSLIRVRSLEQTRHRRISVCRGGSGWCATLRRVQFRQQPRTGVRPTTMARRIARRARRARGEVAARFSTRPFTARGTPSASRVSSLPLAADCATRPSAAIAALRSRRARISDRPFDHHVPAVRGQPAVELAATTHRGQPIGSRASDTTVCAGLDELRGSRVVMVLVRASCTSAAMYLAEQRSRRCARPPPTPPRR